MVRLPAANFVKPLPGTEPSTVHRAEAEAKIDLVVCQALAVGGSDVQVYGKTPLRPRVADP